MLWPKIPLPVDYSPSATAESCLLMMSPRGGRWETFGGLWLDETSFTEGMSVQKFYDKRFGGMGINEEKMQVIVMFPGHERAWSLVLWRNGMVGVPLSVPQAPGTYERLTLNRQRLRYSGEMEKPLFHLMTLKGKERKQMRFQSLLLEKTAFLYLFSHSRKNDLFYIMSIYLQFSQTHTHWPI